MQRDLLTHVRLGLLPPCQQPKTPFHPPMLFFFFSNPPPCPPLFSQEVESETEIPGDYGPSTEGWLGSLLGFPPCSGRRVLRAFLKDPRILHHSSRQWAHHSHYVDEKTEDPYGWGSGRAALLEPGALLRPLGSPLLCSPPAPEVGSILTASPLLVLLTPGHERKALGASRSHGGPWGMREM